LTPPPGPVARDKEPIGDAEALERLQGVKHIVVLMMENRSFDQMLGFLSKHGIVEDVRGLAGGEYNVDDRGEPQESFEWGEAETSFHPPQDRSGKILDPCHGPGCVEEQLKMVDEQSPGGFVQNFLKRRDKHGKALDIPDQYRDLPMGYYSEKHLPVYELLARNYAVCDAWHASIPGDTWPNRLYAMTGREGDRVVPNWLQRLRRRLRSVSGIGELTNAPIFDLPAFTRQLRLDQWRWYSHDPATLRGADSEYRNFRHPHKHNFTYFDRKRMSVVTKALQGGIVELHDSFLDDAAKGQLREVSWIDPNFIDLKVLDPNSDDDHPPSNVRAGQALALETYEALVKSPGWKDTVLVIVYDEHGGFYDHVMPPRAPDGQYKTLGLRVPALVVGPRVKHGAEHTLFEHTALIATILRRFADDPQAVAKMPRRVAQSPHLGVLLEAEPRPELLDRERLLREIDEARDKLEHWRRKARERRRANVEAPSDEADGGAGQEQELLDWQEQFLGFALTMRDQGLPPGQP
jgi:phospholipase C